MLGLLLTVGVVSENLILNLFDLKKRKCVRHLKRQILSYI